MEYKWIYKTGDEFSDIVMYSDGDYLTGLFFDGSRDALKHTVHSEIKDLPVFRETVKWLDIYFSAEEPDFTPKYKINNMTPFRQNVINIMNKIPFGTTITYNDIAKELAKNRGLKKMSAQAVGGAVGRNQICIIIPCHRVVGAGGNLTGYGGGIKNKFSLLKLEKNEMNKYIIPARGTAL